MQVATISRTLSAPIGDVWAITSAFGALKAWMPAVTGCSLEGAGLGAVRTVSLRNGAVSLERLDKVDPARHRVRYAITAPGLSVSRGMVSGTDLESLGPQRTRLTWEITAEAIENADLIRPVLENFVLENIGGLAALLGCGIERGVSQRERVSADPASGRGWGG